MKKRLNSLLALAAVGAGLVVSTPGTAHATNYTIVGTYGANIRTAPTVNSTVVRVVARGASVNVVCQTAGDRFGSVPS